MAKSENTALANLQEQLKQQVAVQQEATETAFGNTIKTNGVGGLTFSGVGDVETPFKTVVIGYVSRKEYYDTPYVDGEFRAPSCFAVGAGTFDSLIPVAESPNKQSEACQGCPLNEYGTSATGKGKACTEYKYAAVMLPDADEDSPIYLAKVSPVGITGFNNFASRINKRYQLPTFAFEAEMDTKAAGRARTMTFKEVGQLPEERVRFFMSKTEEASELLMQKPDFSIGAKKD